MSGLQPNGHQPDRSRPQGGVQAPPDSLQAREAFFASLPSRAGELVPRWMRGSLRIDLTTPDGVEHWYVEMTPGRATVSRENRPAETVLKTTAEVFGQMMCGRLPVLAAAVRFDFLLTGSTKMQHMIARFFYSPDSDPRVEARAHGLSGEQWRQRLDATLARRQVA